MFDKDNFWEEICGTVAFRRLGLKKITSDSLAIFDDWYFDHYPYLKKHLPKNKLKDKSVLEIGLGFGSVGEYLALNSKEYTGVDLAQKPLKLMEERINFKQLKKAKVKNASAIDLPFPQDTFDFVVSLGCIHHTPSIHNSINEIHRVLKPGCEALIMIYAKHSITQLLMPLFYVVDVLKNGFSWNKMRSFRRFAYDSNLEGTGAPVTVFTSKRELENLTIKFKEHQFNRENYWFPFLRKRGFFLNSFLIQNFGNDWYILIKK